MHTIVRCLVTYTFLFSLSGCEIFSDEGPGGISDNVNELQKIVKIDVPAKSIKWEVFGTPEPTGLAPFGPTDYMTLVAQVEVTDGRWFARLDQRPGRVWIAPESARAWLSPYFKQLLVRSNADMTERENCKEYQAAVTKSGRLVNGFVCQHGSSLLIHMMLMSPTEG